MALLVAAMPAATNPAAAQHRPGLTVRVTITGAPEPIVGLLRQRDTSSVTVDSAAISLASISRVEVFQGTGGHGGTGALIGAFAGFVAGGIVGSAASESSGYGLIGGIIGAPILGFVGLAVGAGLPAERWSEVLLDELRSAGGSLSDGRFRIGLGIKF